MHCPSHEVGQDHAKNTLKEWRSLSLGRLKDPGTLLDARNRGPGRNSGGFTLGKAGSTGGERMSWGPQTAQATVGQGPWKTMLLTGIQKGFVHLGMPLYRKPVSHGWVGW